MKKNVLTFLIKFLYLLIIKTINIYNQKNDFKFNNHVHKNIDMNNIRDKEQIDIHKNIDMNNNKDKKHINYNKKIKINNHTNIINNISDNYDNSNKTIVPKTFVNKFIPESLNIIKSAYSSDGENDHIYSAQNPITGMDYWKSKKIKNGEYADWNIELVNNT